MQSDLAQSDPSLGRLTGLALVESRFSVTHSGIVVQAVENAVTLLQPSLVETPAEVEDHDQNLRTALFGYAACRQINLLKLQCLYQPGLPLF